MASAQKSEHMLISERAVFNGQGTAQQQYDAFSNAELDRIHSARCPHGCGANTLRVHAYYERAIEVRGEAGRLRVTRVACSACGRTHALFGMGIVPYSRFLATECDEAARDPFPWGQPLIDFLERRRRQLGRFYEFLRIVIGRTPPADATRALIGPFRLAFLQVRGSAPCYPLADTT